jgi:transcriptional regulator with XRE-family HTH domain
MGYRGKLEAQNRARDLRANGWTYKEICEELGVSRSSVSLWVRDVEFDRAAWEALEIDEARLRLALYLHEGLDLEAANDFWSGVTGIPVSQFGQPYRAVPDPSIRRSKHPMGCPRVRYHSVEVLRSVMGLTDALLTCPRAIPG